MGVQVFAWIATLWEGRPRISVPMLYVLGFLFTFTIGGLTGVMVATVPFDWQAHDSYFVVAHLHYVLIGGAVFPLLAATYYWFPLIGRRQLSERLGKLAFWLIFLGFNLAFFPMHYTGLRGMPRRVYTYESGLGWDWLNLMSTVFAFVLALGVVVILFDVVRQLLRGKPPANENPWEAPSMEWVAGAGINPYGTRSIPVIDSRYPLWDHPDLGQRLDRGEGFLPDAPTLRRETLLTAPLTGTPQQKLTLAGAQRLPFVAAFLTAMFFAGLTLKLPVLTVASATGAVICIVVWLWSLDQTPPRLVDAGRGLALPNYLNTSASHGWWALAVFLIADAAFTAVFVYSYFFLWSQNAPAWPPEGTRMPNQGIAVALGLMTLAAWAVFELSHRFVAHNRLSAAILTMLVAGVAGAAALAGGLIFADAMQLSPTAHAYGAIVATTLGFAGGHIAIGVLMAFWCIARVLTGYLYPGHAMTLQLCRAWWRFTVVVSLIMLLLVTGLPHAIR